MPKRSALPTRPLTFSNSEFGTTGRNIPRGERREPKSPLRTLALGVLAWLAVALAMSGCSAGPAPTVVNLGCETTSEADSYRLLRKAADHEALYTLAGGLKPMSTGIWRGSFSVEDPDLTDVLRVRAALSPFRNDVWYADVQVFDAVHNDERSADAYVVHRAAMAAMINTYAGFWARWGITSCTHPSKVIAIVDRMPRANRWRGYGYLFGYPPGAIDFFIEVGLASDDGREVGPGKDRRFIQIPTFAAETGRFTYAVPLDHAETPDDGHLRRRSTDILSAYSERVDRALNTRSLIAELRRLDREFSSTTTTGVRPVADRQ
ncbi:MAG: hypothetical protein AAGI53_00695 [Planctomycetota bacterium]